MQGVVWQVRRGGLKMKWWMFVVGLAENSFALVVRPESGEWEDEVEKRLGLFGRKRKLESCRWWIGRSEYRNR